MRCVCGRAVRPSWRFYADVVLGAGLLAVGLVVARHDRDAQASRRSSDVLGRQLQSALDSVRDRDNVPAVGRWVRVGPHDKVLRGCC